MVENINSMSVLIFIGTFDLLSITEKLLWSVAVVSTFLLLIHLAMSFLDEEMQKQTGREHTTFRADALTILLLFTFWGWASILAHLWEPSIGIALLYGLPIGIISALAPTLFARFYFIAPVRTQPIRNFNLQEAITSTGEVLRYIPPHVNGRGTVHLNLRNAPKQVKAVSQNGELPEGVPVRVIAVLDEETVIVEPLDGRPPHLPAR